MVDELLAGKIAGLQITLDDIAARYPDASDALKVAVFQGIQATVQSKESLNENLIVVDFSSGLTSPKTGAEYSMVSVKNMFDNCAICLYVRGSINEEDISVDEYGVMTIYQIPGKDKNRSSITVVNSGSENGVCEVDVSNLQGKPYKCGVVYTDNNANKKSHFEFDVNKAGNLTTKVIDLDILRKEIENGGPIVFKEPHGELLELNKDGKLVEASDFQKNYLEHEVRKEKQ
ncbi:MAG: hypothetical protein AAF195_02375 [Pseudomonadota bacterium]